LHLQVGKLYQGRRASLSLEIVVVGCGLGGIAAAHCLAQAGHKVTILEATPTIGEIGAGIQVSPNVTRLLIRWGLGKRAEEVGVKPEGLHLRRCELFHLFSHITHSPRHIGCTGETVGWTRWGDTIEKEHGAPYYHIHVKF
jgi:salicylate hydroxylase